MPSSIAATALLPVASPLRPPPAVPAGDSGSARPICRPVPLKSHSTKPRPGAKSPNFSPPAQNFPQFTVQKIVNLPILPELRERPLHCPATAIVRSLSRVKCTARSPWQAAFAVDKPGNAAVRQTCAFWGEKACNLRKMWYNNKHKVSNRPQR